MRNRIDSERRRWKDGLDSVGKEEPGQSSRGSPAAATFSLTILVSTVKHKVIKTVPIAYLVIYGALNSAVVSR